MNWDAIGAIGELVGAIAVVISLFYLAFQIRANTKSIQGSSYQELLVLFQGVNNQAYNPEFSGVIRRFLSHSDDLSESDTHRGRQYFQNIIRNMQHAHLQFLTGNISETQWGILSGSFGGYAASPGFTNLWEQSKSFNERVDPEYAYWVSRNLEKTSLVS